MRRLDRRTRVPRLSGFTLIEVLAVIAIIAILAIVFIPRLLGMGTTAKEQLTRAYLAEVGGAISEYESKFGDFPPSAWPEAWGTVPNTTNVGAEVLVQSLWSSAWGGSTLGEDHFVNTDEDQSKKALGRLPSSTLFELKDSWDNPIAYVHRSEYDKQLPYVTRDGETGELVDGMVSARQSHVTKGYFNPNRFQLISAGADGRFGSDDDIGNWPLEAKD